MGTPQQHSISEAQAAMRSGKLSSVELVRRCLDRHRRYNGALNATLCLVRGALDQAAQCDADARRGRFQGRLHGIPLVVKDNIDVKGMPTTVASALFAQASPCVRDARAVEKLRGEGAIILAKTNMDEFAAHVSGRTSHWGPSVNPWRMEEGFSPGGSSSGTAAAVAAGFCWGGLGTDTGGSVRLPAAWCGLCGIAPHLRIRIPGRRISARFQPGHRGRAGRIGPGRVSAHGNRGRGAVPRHAGGDPG